MATCVTPSDASQSESASRSSVIVPNVRISFVGFPAGPGTIRQATTVFLWMSSPQHRSYTTSIGASHPTAERGAHPFTECAVRASRAGSDSRWCLGAPGSKFQAGSQHQLEPDLLTLGPSDRHDSRCPPHFHPPVVPVGHGEVPRERERVIREESDEPRNLQSGW